MSRRTKGTDRPLAGRPYRVSLTCAESRLRGGQVTKRTADHRQVPPKPTPVELCRYKKAQYKRRNEIERLLRWLKGLRCIFRRFNKLDFVFIAFVYFALSIKTLRYH